MTLGRVGVLSLPFPAAWAEMAGASAKANKEPVDNFISCFVFSSEGILKNLAFVMAKELVVQDILPLSFDCKQPLLYQILRNAPLLVK